MEVSITDKKLHNRQKVLYLLWIYVQLVILNADRIPMFQHKYAADIWYHADRRRESECFYSFEGCIMHCMTVAEYRK